MFMPIWFPYAQLIAFLNQPRKVGIFVRGVLNNKKDVDDWFGCQANHRCRSRVLDAQSDTI